MGDKSKTHVGPGERAWRLKSRLRAFRHQVGLRRLPQPPPLVGTVADGTEGSPPLPLVGRVADGTEGALPQIRRLKSRLRAFGQVVGKADFVAQGRSALSDDFNRRMALALLLLIGAALRLWLLSRDVPTLDSDEGMVGLMALHLLHGEWTVFLWGQQYMGSLEAVLIAPFLWLFGPSAVTLRLAPMLLGLGFILTVYLLCARLMSRGVGLVAAALLAVGPPFFVVLSVRAYGGYVETLLFGNLLLLLALGGATPAGRRRRMAWLFGLLAGLALWTDMLIVPYLLAAGAIFWWQRRGDLLRGNGLALLAGALLGAAPALVYNLAHQGATVTTLLGLTLVGAPGAHTTPGLVLHNLWLEVTVSFPILLGGFIGGTQATSLSAEAYAEGAAAHPLAYGLSLVLVVGAMALLLSAALPLAWRLAWRLKSRLRAVGHQVRLRGLPAPSTEVASKIRRLKSRLRAFGQQVRLRGLPAPGTPGFVPSGRKRPLTGAGGVPEEGLGGGTPLAASSDARLEPPDRAQLRRQGEAALLIVVGVYAAVFCLNKQGLFALPRYLFPLYAAAPLLAGQMARLWGWLGQRRLGWLGRRAARAALGSMVLALVLLWNLAGDLAITPVQTAARDHGAWIWGTDTQLLALLRAHQVHTVISNDYWEGLRLTFESGETVITVMITPEGHPGFNRYPAYVTQGLADPRPAYLELTGTHEATLDIQRWQAGLLPGYSLVVVGLYTIFLPT